MRPNVLKRILFKIANSDILKLVPILVLAFYIAFIPHLQYPYPLHVDEWLHMAYSKAMLQTGSMTFYEPFYQASTSYNQLGFHLFWGVFQEISEISWMTIFRFFPSIIFIITTLSVYIFANRMGFGLYAALIVSLIPTTVGILGPAFLVPLALGMPFIPLSLFIAFNFKTLWSYLVLFLIVYFMLFVHLPSTVCLLIVLVPYILLNFKGNFRHSLGIILILGIFVVVSLPWILAFLPANMSFFNQGISEDFVTIPRLLQIFGYLPISLCLLGTLILGIKGGKQNYGLILGLLAILLMLVMFFQFHIGQPTVYQRGLHYMMMMASIVAGAGLMWVYNFRLPGKLLARIKIPPIAKNVGMVFGLVLIVLLLVNGIHNRQNALYYHMIDQEDYNAFQWIEENIGTGYDRALLDPWKATAFTAITGKMVYTRIHEAPYANDLKAYEFLIDSCNDTAFLRENNISIVYSRDNCSNPDLVEVRDNVYLLK